MHARFNLDPGQNKWAEYVEIGKNIHADNKKKIKVDLEKFKNADEVLSAEEIIEKWFPAIKADVFLSHSHKDEEIILGLGGWLNERFGLIPFVDSAVWGYSDELLKAIDDKYCKNGDTYNYNLRNRSTSHVHMMLSTALMDMIDKCECIIFVNTPQAFKPADYLQQEGQTESPWIYSEIAMTRMLRQRSAEEHRRKYLFDSVSASTEDQRESMELTVSYPIGTYHLTKLSVEDLKRWEDKEEN